MSQLALNPTISITHRTFDLQTTPHWTLTMTSAQVNETLQTVNEISSFQDYITSPRFSDFTIDNYKEKFSIERICFCFSSLFDWSRKLAPFSQPITSKNKTNQDFVASVFPRFIRQFVRLYFEFSLARTIISFLLIGCYDYSLYFGFGFVTLYKSSLTIIINDM